MSCYNISHTPIANAIVIAKANQTLYIIKNPNHPYNTQCILIILRSQKWRKVHHVLLALFMSRYCPDPPKTVCAAKFPFVKSF